MGIDRAELAELEPEIVAFSELGSYIDMPIHLFQRHEVQAGLFHQRQYPSDIIIVDEALSVGDKDFPLSAASGSRRYWKAA